MLVTTVDYGNAASYEAAFSVDETFFSFKENCSIPVSRPRGRVAKNKTSLKEWAISLVSMVDIDEQVQNASISTVTNSFLLSNYDALNYWTKLSKVILPRSKVKSDRDVTYKAGMSVDDILAAMMPSR